MMTDDEAPALDLWGCIENIIMAITPSPTLTRCDSMYLLTPNKQDMTQGQF